jgi:GxxExxY protein
MLEENLTQRILNCAMIVHSKLGPGLLESCYEECLYYELRKADLQTEKQKPMPLIYDAVHMEIGYRVDLMVDNKVIIEIKSVEALNNVHMAQVITYLRLSGCRVGLLINFNVKSLKEGIKRIVV